MTHTPPASSRVLTQSDLEMVESIIHKYNDDLAVSMARSFERLEQRIDAAESRIYSRLSELEDLLTPKPA